MTYAPNEPLNDVELEVVRASEITPRKVKWLWYPYIPFGKVTLLQGDPGDGKSKLMLTLSALLSQGKPLPFADESDAHEPMTVIYQTTEDDADDTVVPRFIASDGDRERLIFISENKKNLTFGDNRIKEAIEKFDARLLILDPLSSYIGDGCSLNAANETHAEFNHLISVARDTGCAIVIIAHMNKMKETSPLYRTSGSIDIAGAARSILAIERHNKRKNNDYGNVNVDPERIPMNVHFKNPRDKSYMDILLAMEESGEISRRGLKADAVLFDEIVFDVNTMYFETNGGYEWGIDSTSWEIIVNAVGSILIAFGVLNNPTDREYF
ncbi:MAG: AAA family ATPase [Clostridia bacterium]|nr:AAA family ATPase [Clostridia bacterium]